jgi:branched-chain amino acid transport system substrate-binding protein
MIRIATGWALPALAALSALALTAPPARAADAIKIGFSMEQTGNLASGGTTALRAMKIWEQDINAKGGLLGRPVTLVYYDDQSSPANVPGIYTKLLDVDKVDLLVSSYGTNMIAPAMPVAMDHEKVFMTLFGTAVNDKFNYDKYFQILPNGKDTAVAPSKGWFDVAMTISPKPKTVALLAADAEYAQNVIAGARRIIGERGLRIVYDSKYDPKTVDYLPIVRALQAANADLVYVASYPADSVGIIKAVHEVGLKAELFGGGMIGLAFAPIKVALGPMLNGITAFDVYVPEPTMKFPGIEAFLKRYQAVAGKADPLGYYLPPFAYAELQVLADAVTATHGLDQDKLGKYIHDTTFHTIVGDVKFADNGEWEKSRVLFVQYQGIDGSGVEQFKQPGKQVIVYPPEFVSGKLQYPYVALTK